MDIETDGQAPAPEETSVDMTEEASAEVETDELEATASDDDGEDATATPEPKKPAKGVQKRLDELTRLRHDAERDRDYWREMALRSGAAKTEPEPVQVEPTEDQFENYDDYLVAKAKHQALAELRSEQRQESFISAAKSKFTDFVAVVMRPDLPVTQAMSEAIRESEIGADIAYHLGKNPDEAARISRLSPARQAVEIGKLEVVLSAPLAKPKDPPPPPIKPVSGTSAGGSKDPSKMTMAEYVEWRKQNP